MMQQQQPMYPPQQQEMQPPMQGAPMQEPPQMYQQPPPQYQQPLHQYQQPPPHFQQPPPQLHHQEASFASGEAVTPDALRQRELLHKAWRQRSMSAADRRSLRSLHEKPDLRQASSSLSRCTSARDYPTY